jgi:hypothetical protein
MSCEMVSVKNLRNFVDVDYDSLVSESKGRALLNSASVVCIESWVVAQRFLTLSIGDCR